MLLGKDIKTTVNTLVERYKTRNPFELAEYLNIMICDSDIGELKGFYIYKQRKRIIFINQNLQNTEAYKFRDMVAAHELGHAILTPRCSCYFFSDDTFFLKSKPEIEANTFAAELLISDLDIYSNPEMNYSQLSRLLGYSEHLLHLKNTIEFNAHSA